MSPPARPTHYRPAALSEANTRADIPEPTRSRVAPAVRVTSILTVSLKEVAGANAEGEAVIVALGVPLSADDARWRLDCPGWQTTLTWLQLRDRMRGRQTFAKGALEGRTFEWLTTTLDDPREVHQSGGPLLYGTLGSAVVGPGLRAYAVP